MRMGITGKLLTTAAITLVCGAASAVPTLQLGIAGGTYDDNTDTSVATSNPFTLYAFLAPGDTSATLATDFFISVALVPKMAPPGGNYGSFVFNGVTVNATADMSFGTPPLDAVYGGEFGDLPSHDIFKTYFWEYQFNFLGSQTAGKCGGGDLNVEDDPDLSTLCTGGAGELSQYYMSFVVDTTNLSDAYVLHFDLYNEDIACLFKDKGDCQADGPSIDDFAPFSHDAQSSGSSGGTSNGGTSNGGTSNGTQVPEPASSLVLLGLGLLGLGFMRRNRQAA